MLLSVGGARQRLARYGPDPPVGAQSVARLVLDHLLLENSIEENASQDDAPDPGAIEAVTKGDHVGSVVPEPEIAADGRPRIASGALPGESYAAGGDVPDGDLPSGDGDRAHGALLIAVFAFVHGASGWSSAGAVRGHRNRL